MKNVIFDFDGTIVESLDFVIDMYMRWYPNDQHLKTIDREKLRNMSITSVMEELRVRPWRVPALIVRGRIEMNKKITDLKLVDGMDDLLKYLDDNKIQLMIASSNSSRNINKYMKNKDMRKIFKRVYGSVGLLSKGKALKKIIDKNHMDKRNTYYVGDEIRDIRAAKNAGIISIGVTWGYNGIEVMKKEKPDFLVSKPSEIKKIINS